jgi:hypothetical protein
LIPYKIHYINDKKVDTNRSLASHDRLQGCALTLRHGA